MKSYKGILTALATPYDKDDKINEKALFELIDHNIKMGVSGFFVCGSSAEAFLLTTDERKQIMKAVKEYVKDDLTLIAHVGCISTEQACELGKYAKELGYDAISSVAPFYHRFRFDEIKQYFSSLATASELPLFIYNIPAFTGVTFTFEQLSELLSMDGIAGVKHTSGDYMLLSQLKTAFPEKIIYNGYDETFLCGLTMGADGAIGSNFNFMADKFVEIYDLFCKGEIEEATKLQNKATQMITVIMQFGLSQSIKAVLRHQGIDCGICRPPFLPLTTDQETVLLEKLTEIDKR